MVRPRVWKRETILSPSEVACEGGRGDGANGVLGWGIVMLRARDVRGWRKRGSRSGSSMLRGSLKGPSDDGLTVKVVEHRSKQRRLNFNGLDMIDCGALDDRVRGGAREDADPIRLDTLITCAQPIWALCESRHVQRISRRT